MPHERSRSLPLAVRRRTAAHLCRRLEELTVMSTEPIITNLTEIVGDHEIPCDFHKHSVCGPATARWVMFVRCPACGHSPTLLVCGRDKAILESSEAGILCGGCEEVVAPARHMFYRIEWLK